MAPVALFSFQSITNMSGFGLEKAFFHAVGVLMNAMARMSFDHLAEFHIAAYGPEFHVCQPLPGSTVSFDVVEKTIRTLDQRAVLTVRSQTQINSIEITFTFNVRQGSKHQLGQTRISFIARQRRNRGRHHRIVDDQEIEIGAIVDAATAQPAKSEKGQSGTGTEWTKSSRHFPSRHQVSNIHTRDRQLGLQTIGVENRKLVACIQGPYLRE